MDEAGRVMTPESAIAMFERSNAWLRERRLNGPPTCGCGACWFCAYNTLVRMKTEAEWDRNLSETVARWAAGNVTDAQLRAAYAAVARAREEAR